MLDCQFSAPVNQSVKSSIRPVAWCTVHLPTPVLGIPPSKSLRGMPSNSEDYRLAISTMFVDIPLASSTLGTPLRRKPCEWDRTLGSMQRALTNYTGNMPRFNDFMWNTASSAKTRSVPMVLPMDAQQ